MAKYTVVGQKFNIGDKVYRKNIFGSSKGIEKRLGTIYGVFTKKNSKGSHHYITTFNGRMAKGQKRLNTA